MVSARFAAVRGQRLEQEGKRGAHQHRVHAHTKGASVSFSHRRRHRHLLMVEAAIKLICARAAQQHVSGFLRYANWPFSRRRSALRSSQGRG